MTKARLLIAAAASTLALTACNPYTPWHPTPRHTPQCQEDQPCWNCHTMGNRICGPGRG